MSVPRGPDLDLQWAIAALLTTSADLKTLFGGTVRIEAGTAKPYITIGEGSMQSAAVEYFNPVDVFVTLHIWSATSTFAEAKQIAAAIYAALHEKQDALALTEHRCTALRFDRDDVMRDPDGVTKHIAMTFVGHVCPKT